MRIRAENLHFAYHAGHPVLKDVSVEVRPGTVTALFGPNGCGKSTLLRCLNGSLRPQAGKVLLEDRDVLTLTPREAARRIAVVPQDTPTDIPFTARQMAMLGRYAHWDAWGQETPDDAGIVQESLARMGIADLAGRLFSELSGGERQRVILARALAQQAQVLLLDEPTSHLDIAHQLELYHLARRLSDEGKTVLMVCHDVFVAPMFADAAVLLADGKVLSAGAPRDVLTERNVARAYGIGARIAWEGTSSFRAAFTSMP